MHQIIYFEMAAVPLYLIIMFTTIYRGMTRGRSNVLFLYITGFSLAAVLFDLVGTIDDRKILDTEMGLAVVNAAEHIYFVARNGINVFYLLFIFSVTRTWHRLRGVWRKAFLLLPYALILVLLLTNGITKAVFTITPEYAYQRGPLIGVVYLSALFYLVFGIAYLSFNSNIMERDEWLALYLMYIMNGAAVLIQLVFPWLLLECFVTSLTLVFIVLFVRRPEKQVDVNTHLPTFGAFQEEIRKITATGQKVQIIIVGIRNAADIRDRLGDTSYFEFIHAISNAIEENARENRLRHELYFEPPGHFYIILENLDYNPSRTCSEIKNHFQGKRGIMDRFGISADMSIAVVRFPEEISDQEELTWFGHNFLRFAGSGKVYSHAAQITAQREYQIEIRMNEIMDRAFSRETIKINYYPIWSINKGRADFAEALLSLHDEQFGDIDDETLYRAAGERGRLGKLGDYVTEKVFSYVSSEAFSRSGYRGVVIRLSVSHGSMVDYPDSLWTLREQYGIHPEQICFAVDAPDASEMEGSLGENMKKLSLLGYRFCYDGFGFSRSDLQSIIRLPFFAVRLDRRMAPDSEVGMEILEGNIQLLKRLSLEVVARNVDDAARADVLKRMGCDYIQGKLRGYGGPSKPSGKEILVVDDTRVNRRLLQALLRPYGVHVSEAESGQEAVEKASSTDFDLILMDHLMPGMSGIEAMKKIRELPEHDPWSTKIVAVTADQTEGARDKFLREGFDAFLAKPVEADRLEQLMGKFLQLGKQNEEKEEKAEEAAPAPASPEDPELPVIFGVDVQAAVARLGSRKLFEGVLREFLESIDHQAKLLEGMLSGLPDTIGDYRIQVHGMKGVASSAGIIPLAGMAMVLEEAADKKDLSTINELHDVFLREWRSYKGYLGEYLGTSGNTEKEKIGEKALRVVLMTLSEAMVEMDVDTADKGIRRLSDCILPEGVAAEFEGLKAAVTDLDQERAAQILGRCVRSLSKS